MRWTWLALIPLLVGCGELDDIDAGVCGNGILEKGEDCDSSDPSCSPPGAELECRYVAVNGVCPPGGAAVPSTAGGDEVCRFASGDYESSSFIPTGANVLVGLADFDGDFALDPLAIQPGEVSVYFHDDRAEHVGTATVPSPLAFPAVGSLGWPATELSPAKSSFVFAEGGLFVMLGQAGRQLQPKSYAPYPIDKAIRDAVFADVNPALPGDEMLALLVDDVKGSKLVDVYTQQLPSKPLPPLSSDPNLEVNVVAGEVDTLNECDELVLAQRNSPELYVIRLCEGDKYSVSAPTVTVKLPAGMTVSSPPRLARLNLDDKLDLMVQGTAPDGTKLLLVGYGKGDGNFVSAKTFIHNEVGALYPNGARLLNEAFPLAAGQLNPDVDTEPDFVTGMFELPKLGDPQEKVSLPSFLLLSGGPDVNPPCLGWESSTEVDGKALVVPGYYCGGGGWWASGLITYLNGDSKPDVALSLLNSPMIEALMGTGFGIFNYAQIAAQGNVSDLLSGDFDGDTVPDLAFVEGGTKGNTVAVAFGKVVGPPEKPVRLSGLGAVNHLRGGYVTSFTTGFDAVADLAFLSEDPFTKEPRAALLYGSTNRFFQAPFDLVSADSKLYSNAVRALIGNFDQSDEAGGANAPHGDVAVVTTGDFAAGDLFASLNAKLWLLPSTGEAELSNATKQESAPLQGFFACAASMTVANLDGAGPDEIVMMGIQKETPKLIVARKGSGPGFELGQQADLQELYLDLLSASRCGFGQVGDIDALTSLLLARPPRAMDLTGRTGAEARPDIVAHALLDENKVAVAIFPNDGNGNLDVAKRVLLELPPELAGQFILSFDVLNADSDPEKELVFSTVKPVNNTAAFGPAYLAEMDREQGKLVLTKALPGPEEVISIVTGDVDRDGVDDVLLSGLWGVEVLRGTPRAP